MTYPILYQYSSTGKVVQWQIIVEGDSYYTISGQKDGKLITSKPTRCVGKSKGRKNETSGEQQAKLEAESKIQKKKDDGYNEVLTDKKNFVEPMLAQLLEKGEELDFKVRTFGQPKLDGLRSINEKNSLSSRNGKPYVSTPHLYQDEVRLDGELYTHLYHDNFNEIVSLCKQQTPTKEQLWEAEQKVEFWAYDFPEHKGVFSERYEALKKWHRNTTSRAAKHIKITPTIELFSMEDLYAFHAANIEAGYEGTIIRQDLADYQYNKRPKQLLKYKDFIDEEFTVIDCLEGKGGRVGTVGKLVVQLPGGITCESGVSGTHEYLRDVWKNKGMYINTKATIKHFGFTPAGKLRFPVAIKLNREAYE